MLVQTLVTEPPVERFDVGVLVWLAGLDQSQRDSLAMRPRQHGFAGELRAVVGADDGRCAALRTDTVQDAREMVAADRMFRHDGHDLVRRVIHDHRALDRTPRGRPVKHEVHRPDLVRLTRSHQRLPVRHRDLLAAPAPNMQLLEPIQPLNPLVVHALAGLLELQVDHPDAVASMPLRQGDDAGA
jgi:hypothetical protein